MAQNANDKRCADCGRLIPPKRGDYCMPCLRIRQDALGQLRVEFNRIRGTVIKRDGGMCSRCCSTVKLEVHHIVELASGGTNDMSNLVTLCHSCHMESHGKKSNLEVMDMEGMLEDRRDLPVFIHSELDDMGLTPNAFRLYCHLARRAGTGVAWPSYQSMGDVCFAAIAEGRSRRNIAIRSMTELVERGLINKQARTNDDGNQTNLYYLTPRREWTPSIPTIPGGHSHNTTPSIPTMPKGTPSEGTPMKDDVVVDDGVTLADVFRTWSNITKGTFNSLDSDTVKDLVDTHGAEAVNQAMLDANLQGKRTLAYVNGILRNRQNGTEKPPQQQGNGRPMSKVEKSLAAVDRVMAMAERGELDEWLK